MWPCARSFQVGAHNSILSDHSIILLELTAQQYRPHAHTNESTKSPLLQFDWNPESMARLKDQLSDPHTQLKIQIMEAKLKLDNPDLDALVSDFSDLLLEETKKVVKFRERGPPSRKQKAAKKWYDQSLRALKKDISHLNADLRTNPSTHLSQQIRAKTAAYRRPCPIPKHTDLSSSSKIKCLPRRTDPPKNGGRCYVILDLMPSGKILINTSK